MVKNACWRLRIDLCVCPIFNPPWCHETKFYYYLFIGLVLTAGEGYLEVNGFGTFQKKKGPLAKIIAADTKPRPHVPISLPGDFRRVSAIIDVDVIPETHRRVKLMKNGSDKPLGFYIRDGTSVRVSPHGLEKVPAIFISRLVPGGLAESTGLLAVNDEVLEVNGIEVAGKTLDQVTDMMVANSSNLIITVKPVNQRNNILPYRGGSGRMSQKSTGSYASAQSTPSVGSDEVRDLVQEEEDDEVKDHTSAAAGGERVEATAVNISSSTTQSCSTTDSEIAAALTEDKSSVIEIATKQAMSEKDSMRENGKNSPVITF